MKYTKVWLLKLVFPFAYGRLVASLFLLLVLVPFFYLGVREGHAGNTPALFFSMIIAYIIPVTSYITARLREALLELRPILDLDEAGFSEALTRMDSFRLHMTFIYIVCGVLAGLAQMSFIEGSARSMIEEMLSNQTAFISTLGAVLVWVVMTTAISLLIQQAVVFARLGRDSVRISLLHIGRLVPFARVAIFGSLALIGALALFPLMSVNSEMTLQQLLPGAVATFIALPMLLSIPIWPLHRRIASLKEDELASLDRRIDACLGGGDGTGLEADQLRELTPLLGYRREVARVSTWPFDAGSMTRLLLYLIIPPLTWVGAALIENLVDSVI